MLDAADHLCHREYAGSYPHLLQSCLATNMLGDAYVVALAMERARLKDVDSDVRGLNQDPDAYLVLAACADEVREMERAVGKIECDAAVKLQLGKLKRAVNKALEKEVSG